MIRESRRLKLMKRKRIIKSRRMLKIRIRPRIVSLPVAPKIRRIISSTKRYLLAWYHLYHSNWSISKVYNMSWGSSACEWNLSVTWNIKRYLWKVFNISSKKFAKDYYGQRSITNVLSDGISGGKNVGGSYRCPCKNGEKFHDQNSISFHRYYRCRKIERRYSYI